MKILIMGGVFDKPPEFQRSANAFPEIVLASGLRKLGHEVLTQGISHTVNVNGMDLVHVHHFGIASFTLVLERPSMPIIYTAHEFPLNNLIVDKFTQRNAKRFLLRNADAIVALSRLEEKALIAKIGVDEDRIFVIPNGRPSEYFYPECIDNADRAHSPRLLYVGQITKLKGVENLLKAAARVIKKYPTLTVKIVTHSSTGQDKYVRMAAELGIEKHLLIEGMKDAHQLRKEYCSADLLVLPSLAECLPSVITEAILCGVPVVASAVGGVPEQLKEGVGFLVPPGDVDALVDAISRVFRDKFTVRQLALATQKKARVLFSVELMVQRHIEMFERVLNWKPRRRKTTAWILSRVLKAKLWLARHAD